MRLQTWLVMAVFVLLLPVAANAIEPPPSLSAVEVRALPNTMAEPAGRIFLLRWRTGTETWACTKVGMMTVDLAAVPMEPRGWLGLLPELAREMLRPECGTDITSQTFSNVARRQRAAWNANCSLPLDQAEQALCREGLPTWRVARNAACTQTDRSLCARPVLDAPSTGRAVGRAVEGTGCDICTDPAGATVACRASTGGTQWRIVTATNAARGYALCALR